MKITDLATLPDDLYEVVGGKAKGLAILAKIGLKIPRGFVAINVRETDTAEIAEYYTAHQYGVVAVRSSASSEDGAVFSSAGQYESVLNVNGLPALKEAVKVCLNSLNSERAQKYNANFNEDQKTNMNLVIQEMVDAQFAGVCFTKDPVSKKDYMLIEAVSGLGEALVSGTAQSSSYQVHDNHVEGSGILKTEIVQKIAKKAAFAKEIFGIDLDLEWAIDKNGTLFFLQARPITTLDEASIDELDSRYFRDEKMDVFTTRNVGEMLPGAITPLSLSTSVAAIDVGLRRMLVKAGAFKNMAATTPGSCVATFNNHLFFNLTSIYKMGSTVMGCNKESVEMSICGEQLDTPPSPWEQASKIRRVRNGVSYFRFVLSRKKAMKKVEKLVRDLKVPHFDDPVQYYEYINARVYDIINDATWYHYITSSHSGAMSSALLFSLQRFYGSVDETKAVIASLLENIDGIESVDILRSMREIAKSVLLRNPDAGSLSPNELYRLIQDDTGEIKKNYNYFIKRHGHRAIREAEMRSVSWKNDINGLMENILMVIKAGNFNENRDTNFDLKARIKEVAKGKPRMLRMVLPYLVKQARQGVYNREYTKARFVKAIDAFKDAYVDLAKVLVKHNILPETDLIYFLTQEELGKLILEKDTKLVKKAFQRRNILAEQKEVVFEDVYIGKPTPIDLDDMASGQGTTLKGAPISRGDVKGIARVVHSVEDAKLLKAGEIMVAAFTDIGWSPYYAVIKGLITEVGSALSHGAVVAREYALPLVVNVNNATRIIKTGDLIHLNATKGAVTILESV